MNRRAAALKAFLFLLWLVCLYRAATQSITHDEAFTWELYLTGRLGRIFSYYDANNHLLNTLLMWFSVRAFGLSELSMRIPALAGAAVYFAAVYRLSRGSAVACGLLALNPFVLDFMVAARGYGMGLGLWMYGLAMVLEGKPGRPAGVLLGLAAAANPIFLVPASLTAALAWRRKVVLPFAGVLAAVLAALPLRHMGMNNFYVGAASPLESLRSLAQVSFLYSPPLRFTVAGEWVAMAIAYAAPAVVLAGLVDGWRSRNLPAAALVAAGSAMLLALAHFATGAPYPIDRTGIYFLPLVSLVWLGFAARIAAARVFAAALAVLFLVQFDTRRFALWEYDADTRALVARLAEAGKGKAVRLAHSWQLEPSLNFYRVKNRYGWMPPATRDPIVRGADYYLLMGDDRALMDAFGLVPLAEGRISRTVLAAAGHPR